MSARALPELPSDTDVSASLQRYGRSVKRHYGPRLVGLYLFGSRARNEHRPESDVDVAVVLRDSVVDYWAEVFALSDLGYDELVEHGVYVEGRPVSEAEWNDPTRHVNPSLMMAIRRDARRLEPVE